MTQIEVLQRSPIFRELNDQQLQKVAGMCHEEVFQIGESLCKQGRTQEKLFLIVDGLVGIYIELGPMSHRQVQSASNYDIVGWTAMIPPYRNHGAARAIETTKTLGFIGLELAELCAIDPTIGCRLHRGLAGAIGERLHNAYTQLVGVSVQDAY